MGIATAVTFLYLRRSFFDSFKAFRKNLFEFPSFAFMIVVKLKRNMLVTILLQQISRREMEKNFEGE